LREESYRIGLASTYPPIHCGVAEYTRMLATALSSAASRHEVIVLAEEEVGNAYTDPNNGVLVVPSFRRGALNL